MSCFCMPKKLKQLPSSSKKAWKSFTSSVSPKLLNLHNNLKLPKSVTKHVRRLPFIGRASRGRGRPYSYKEYEYHHLQQSVCNSPVTVYIDRLFEENIINSSTEASSGRVRGSNSNNNSNDANNSSKNGNVKWKDYVARLPVIRGVDERAEEFISRFRQEMQLQREQSILDFQEMLARTT